MHKLTKLIALFVLAVSISLPSILKADDNYQFKVDYSIFKGSDNSVLLEIYYSFYQKGLKYTYDGDRYVSKPNLQINIIDKSDGKEIFSESYNVSSDVPDTSGGALENKIIGQLTYVLNPGEYSLKVTGIDSLVPTNFTVYGSDVSITPFSDSVSLSDIQLSSGIKKSDDKESVFYKNTLEVLPNPDGLFGNNMSELYYYYEIYGITDNNISNTFIINATLTDPNGSEIKSDVKRVKAGSVARAEFGNFKIDSLPTGLYNLKVSVLDPKKKIKIDKTKKFAVYNSNIIVENVGTDMDNDFLKSSYANRSEEVLDKDFDITLYIRSDQETKKYNSLKTVDEKRKFMFDFWKQRDPNPSTPQNEFQIDYLKRILESDAQFKQSYKEGWRTDRGRIYVLYGKPDDIERFPYSSDSKSYEIWRYDQLEGGVECVFVEETFDYGDYKLVHSTINNEINDTDWKRKIGKGSFSN